jgi:hypothetical protein
MMLADAGRIPLPWERSRRVSAEAARVNQVRTQKSRRYFFNLFQVIKAGADRMERRCSAKMNLRTELWLGPPMLLQFQLRHQDQKAKGEKGDEWYSTY